MISKYLDIIETQKNLTRELIQARQYQEGLNFILNNIKNAKTYKTWQKLKIAKQFLKNIKEIIKTHNKNKALSFKNIPITIIINPKPKQSTKTKSLIRSIFSQSYPNIELICIKPKSTTRDIKKLLNEFKKLKKIDIKLLEPKNSNPVDIINQSKGKYICNLKTKYKLNPNYIEKCIIKMELEKLDICYSEINSNPRSKNKGVSFNKLLTYPEYAIVSKKYLLSLISLKKPSLSKIKEPLLKKQINK